MNHGAPAENVDLDGLLESLDEADAALRVLYRKLADNPDLASEFETRLRELHANRLDLAQQVGLATLAARRTSAEIAQPEEVPAVLETSSRIAEGVGAAAQAVVQQGPPPGLSAPSAPPASDAQLAQWKGTVRSNGLGSALRTALSPATVWPLVLHDLMETVGPPRDQETSVATIEEIDALEEVVTDERQEQWVRLPKHVQQLWLSMLVARTRVLKESPSWTETKDRVKEINGRYLSWAKEHSPGHVNGVQLRHAPMHGSWAQDARHYWGALADLLGEELVVRPAPTARKKAKPLHDDEDDAPDIEPTWRLLPLVRGRKAVILGGDPREPNRERLERAFQLASLDWPAIEGPRKVEAAVERIRKGAYGLMLVLTPFVFHKQSNPIVEAAKEAGVPWAMAEGYGVAAVKLALERFLGGPCSWPS